MSQVKEVQTDHVELLASGYEYVCPGCEHYNTVREVTETVTCSNKKCGQTFIVTNALHAFP